MIRKATLNLIGSLFIIFAACQGSVAQPSPGELFALDFRDHVVKIRAAWKTGELQEGFGFVVADGPAGAYIVTANHVVRGAAPDQVAETVTLAWFSRTGEVFPATLLGTSDDRRDLAVLRSRLPEGLQLRPELMVRPQGRLQRSTPVWYVGRAGQWYVPSQAGTVNSIDLDDQIIIDGLNVQVGTSGAPLLEESGIAGMIVEDQIGGVARALGINFIERAFEVWNLPWGIDEARPETTPKTLAPAQTSSEPAEFVLPNNRESAADTLLHPKTGNENRNEFSETPSPSADGTEDGVTEIVKATYGDWEVRCALDGTDCFVYQLALDRRNSPIAEVSILELPQGGEAVAGVTVVSPLGTLIPSGVRFQVDDNEARQYEVNWCNTAGCFTRFGLTSRALQDLKGGSNLRLTIFSVEDPETAIHLDVSLDGFNSGFGSL